LEVDKVIAELTSGAFASAGSVAASKTAVKASGVPAKQVAEEEEVDASTQELLKRLQAL
jgi:hypothetical protein